MNEQKLDMILAELGKLNTRITSIETRMTSLEAQSNRHSYSRSSR